MVKASTQILRRLAWLEQGGIIAIAHVRGGGELSFQWDEAGRGKHKINSVNDFLDCAEHLVQEKYTRSDRLVASSASAGGIVVGTAVALRPELFATVSVHSGMLNMARLDEIQVGHVNVPELGGTTTQQRLEALHSMDAY